MKRILTIAIPIIFLGLIGMNYYHTLNNISELRQLRQQHPYTFFGDRVIDIKPLLAHETHIGYYTDAPIDSSQHQLAIHHLAHFQQIQLELAPIIVELNNTSHKYVLIYCTNPALTIKKIIELKAKPIMKRPDGLVLVQTK